MAARVLLVEDEAHLAKGIEFNLGLEGYEVSVVGDGLQAESLLTGPARRRPSISSCSTSCCPASTACRSRSACARPATTRPCWC